MRLVRTLQTAAALPQEAITAALEGATLRFLVGSGRDTTPIVVVTAAPSRSAQPDTHVISLPDIQTENAIRIAMGIAPRRSASAEKRPTPRPPAETSFDQAEVITATIDRPDAIVCSDETRSREPGEDPVPPTGGLAEVNISGTPQFVQVEDLETHEDGGVGGWATNPEDGRRVPLIWTAGGGWVLDLDLFEQREWEEYARGQCESFGQCDQEP